MAIVQRHLTDLWDIQLSQEQGCVALILFLS